MHMYECGTVTLLLTCVCGSLQFEKLGIFRVDDCIAAYNIARYVSMHRLCSEPKIVGTIYPPTQPHYNTHTKGFDCSDYI